MISVIFVAGTGTGYAGIVLPMITLAGNVQVNGDLNVDETTTDQTIEDLEAQINALKNAVFFKDVVVANNIDDDISVLLGNGDGTFARIDRAVGNGPRSVAIGDLNNDGDQDVVVVNQGDDDISVLLGNGDGTFTAQPDVAVGNNPTSVAIGDIDSPS